MPVDPAATTQNMRRGGYVIDRDFQMREVNRGVSMFSILIFVQVLLFVGVAYLHKHEMLDSVTAPVTVVTVSFVVPIAMCIMYSLATVRQTHRVAGAAYRLEQDLTNMVENRSFRFKLREGDYLQSLALSLNSVMDCLDARDSSLSEGLAELYEYIGELDIPEKESLQRQISKLLKTAIGERPENQQAAQDT